MTNDAALLSEVWDVIKPHVERGVYLEICEQLVEVLDSHNISEGMQHESGIEPILQTAIKSYFGDDEVEGEEYDY